MPLIRRSLNSFLVLADKHQFQNFQFSISHIRYSVYVSFTARTGSRILQGLPAADRATAITTLADLLISQQSDILTANAEDIAAATKGGLAKPLLSRLSLTPAKLNSLAAGKSTESRSSKKVFI